INIQDIKRLSIKELNEILEHSPKLDELPEEIQSNEIYRLYLNQDTQNDWKADGYRWKSGSWRKWPKNNNLFKKKYFTCINGDGEETNPLPKLILMEMHDYRHHTFINEPNPQPLNKLKNPLKHLL
ncbi:unnamed protein product, partial [Didymodactylos carnosus]